MNAFCTFIGSTYSRIFLFWEIFFFKFHAATFLSMGFDLLDIDEKRSNTFMQAQNIEEIFSILIEKVPFS